MAHTKKRASPEAFERHAILLDIFLTPSKKVNFHHSRCICPTSELFMGAIRSLKSVGSIISGC